MTETEHSVHRQHDQDCGHVAVQHDGHTDYLHDGHLHHPHEDHNHCDDHGELARA